MKPDGLDDKTRALVKDFFEHGLDSDHEIADLEIRETRLGSGFLYEVEGVYSDHTHDFSDVIYISEVHSLLSRHVKIYLGHEADGTASVALYIKDRFCDREPPKPKIEEISASSDEISFADQIKYVEVGLNLASRIYSAPASGEEITD